MRKIINGRTYNTSTSKRVGYWTNGIPSNDFGYCYETLFKNTKGAYFLHGEGGAYSKYATMKGDNRGWGEQIVPMTTEEAQEWAEERLDANEYEEEFGEQEEAGSDLTTRERVNLTLDSGIMANLRKLAAKTGVPMSIMVDRAIMAMHGKDFIEGE